MLNTEEILNRFQNPRKSGRGWIVRCPAHDDRKNSLSITEADGKFLLKCQAGCATESVIDAVGLQWRDLFSGGNGKPQDAVIQQYVYTDEDGNPLYRVCRTASKNFFQERFEGGAYTAGLNGARRVLYSLPDLIKSATVFVVEGEKDCQTLRAHGMVATTNVGGANNWNDAYAEFFKGKQVTVIPDNDEPGRRHALKVAKSILPVAEMVKIVGLPNVPEKGDVTDYLTNHNKEDLLALIESAKPFTDIDAEWERQESEKSEATTEWPTPKELPRELPSVPAMDPKMIPEVFRPWLCDIAERMQCPLDFAAIAAVITAASLIGRGLAIRPKQQDDWTVIPNLWGGVVGRPGIMKTPALDEGVKPLQRLEREAEEVRETQKQAHELKRMVLKAQREQIQKEIKQAIANGRNTNDFEVPKDEELILRRYVVNDSTVEKLGELLNQNPNGLLLFRDELIGWFRTLDRDGHENDRAFYLEAWNGNGSYTYDRIGRGTLHIQAACVSILGGIQPGPLNDYLQSTLKGAAGADGLLQRFQLLVYPDDPGPWKNIDRWPNTEAKNAAFQIFKELAQRGSVSFVSSSGVVYGGQNSSGGADEPSFLRFSKEAQAVFDDWREELENKIRSRDEHPAIEAHLSKYRSLMPSLALVFHVISTMNGDVFPSVSKEAAKMAAAWCDYLEAHARRVYHGLIQPDVSTAHRLAKKITDKALSTPFTTREVYRKCWTGLLDAEVIDLGAEILDELGWIKTRRITTGANGGRPTLEYSIHPQFECPLKVGSCDS
jgi:hypothetical protein